MQIGIIGAGKVGCSLGRYFVSKGQTVTGYYDRHPEDAAEAANQTRSEYFEDLTDLILASDTLFIATPDDAIKTVWDDIARFDIRDYVVGHFSGSLSSDVFTNIKDKRAHACSLHPIFAFSGKNIPLEQLNEIWFTVEGDEVAVSKMQEFAERLGNPIVEIRSDKKALYHSAASMVSNHVLGVLQTGFDIMEDCGFTPVEAYNAFAPLIINNVEHAMKQDCIEALTGPIERNDVGTVRKHIDALSGMRLDIYLAIGKELVDMASRKHPERDYTEMAMLF